MNSTELSCHQLNSGTQSSSASVLVQVEAKKRIIYVTVALRDSVLVNSSEIFWTKARLVCAVFVVPALDFVIGEMMICKFVAVAIDQV